MCAHTGIMVLGGQGLTGRILPTKEKGHTQDRKGFTYSFNIFVIIYIKFSTLQLFSLYILTCRGCDFSIMQNRFPTNWKNLHGNICFFSQWIVSFHIWAVSCQNQQNDCAPSENSEISLGFCPVWSESSLSAWRKLASLATQWPDSKDSDQTGRMTRLIRFFAGCTVILLVLSCCGSYRSFLTVRSTFQENEFYCLSKICLKG